MSDQIVQQLGFDASQALASLSQLDSALATFEGHMQRSAIVMRDFNAVGNQTSSLLSRLATNANKAASALSALNGNSLNGAAANVGAATSAFTNLGNAVNQAANNVAAQTGQMAANVASNTAQILNNTSRLTTSFQLLSRIVFTQAVIRALSTLRNTLREVGGEAVDFQNKIALIRTIDNSGRSFNSLANSVRGVSDQFNIPLLQTAEGLYQTISNQIGEAGDSLQFLTEAAKFAKATDSNLQDSVDLLSGAIKSFGLDVDDTGRVASTFFKTIDLGRITADRLANSFGRVGPQAGALGLSLEEVGASIAAISIKGSSSNESLTQFRNILTGLVKPTEAMKETLKDLGFTSAQSAIKTLGLTGVLKALADSTNGSNEAMAKLFPNVRGLSGAIALTSDDLQTLSADLDEMVKASNQTSNNKFLEATATDAQRVTSDINKLKNALIVDLGQAFLRTGVQLSDLIGGVGQLVSIIGASPPLVLGLGTSLLSLAVAAKTAAAAGRDMSLAFAGLTLIPAAFGLGKSLGSFIDEKIADKAFEKVRDLEKAQADALAELRRSSKEELDAATAADQERIKSARQAAVEITKSFIETNDQAISLNKILMKQLKSDADDITGAYERVSRAIGQAIADAERSKQQSAGRIQSLQDEQAKIALQGQLAGLSESQKVFALSQQALQFASQASSLISSSSGDESRAARGRQLGDLARQTAAEAASIAQRTNNRGLEARAAGALNEVLKSQISAEQSLSRAEDSRVGKLQQQDKIVKAQSDALKEQVAILLQNSGALDKTGKQFDESEQKRRAALREQASQAISKLTLSQASLADLKSLGLGDIATKLQSTLTQAPIKLTFDADSSTKRVQDRLTQAFAEFKVKLNVESGLDIGALEQLVGQKFSSPDTLFAGLDQAAEKVKEIRKQLSDSSLADTSQQQIRGQLAALTEPLQARAQQAAGLGASPEALAALRDLLALLEGLSSKSQLAASDLLVAEQRVNAFTTQTRGAFTSRVAFNTTNDALEGILVKLRELSEVQKTALDPAEAERLNTQLQSINNLLGTLNGRGVGEQLKAGADALQSATSPAATIAADAAQSKASLEAGAQAWIKASEATFKTPGSGQSQGFAEGGLVRYFAAGGFTPRGTDTIPAMLSPGEFVINAAATRKFYSQLVAINSGRQPIYRAEGGPTTFNFGDIHVIESSNGQATARDFVKGVRRELRRGTSRL